MRYRVASAAKRLEVFLVQRDERVVDVVRRERPLVVDDSPQSTATDAKPRVPLDDIGQYRQILEKAKEEYEYIPATEYYKKGYNLYLRLEKYMHNHFLFLYDPRVRQQTMKQKGFLEVIRESNSRPCHFEI